MTSRPTVAEAITRSSADREIRDAARAVLLLEAGFPVTARLVAALYGVSASTVRRRLAAYKPTQLRPETYWSAADVRHEFGGKGDSEFRPIEAPEGGEP